MAREGAGPSFPAGTSAWGGIATGSTSGEREFGARSACQWLSGGPRTVITEAAATTLRARPAPVQAQT